MRIAVLGGGNGCYAGAADLAEKGHELRLWRRDAKTFTPVLRERSITLTDFAGTRRIALEKATLDLREAIEGAELVLIPLPATAQEGLFPLVAPLLRDGQVVFLPPGTFGGYLLARAMQSSGNRARIAIAETGTLPYLARKRGEDHVAISARATRLPTGVFPACETDRAIEIIGSAFPSVERCVDLLDGALMNAGPIIHPPLILMNAGPLEHCDAWDIHNEGTQASIRRVIDALDGERIRLREALGYGTPHFPLADHYDDRRDEWMYGKSSHEKLTASGDWRERIDLRSHRYMREDIALGLVFYLSLANWAGIGMPIAEGLVALASAVVDEDLRKGTRSWEALALANESRESLRRMLRLGLN